MKRQILLLVVIITPLLCAWLLYNWIEPLSQRQAQHIVAVHDADSTFVIVDTVTVDTVPTNVRLIHEDILKVTDKDTVVIYQKEEEEIVIVSDTDTVFDQKTIKRDTLHPFHYLVRAVGWVESSNNNNAINGSHVGYLQISPGVVADVNNYLQKKGLSKMYTLADRYNREKSIEMYYYFQEIHNPKMNIEKAIRDWRHGPYFKGTTNSKYRNSVLAKLKELQEEK